MTLHTSPKRQRGEHTSPKRQRGVASPRAGAWGLCDYLSCWGIFELVRGIPRSSEQRGLGIEDNADRDGLQQGLHPALGNEGAQEVGFAKFRQDLRSDAAAEEDAAGRQQ